MEITYSPQWLVWAREIQALAQTGHHFSENEYEKGRYLRLLDIAAEIIAHHTEIQYTLLRDAFRAQIGYATPRVDVRGAVFCQEKLLLVRERADGGWTLPGGWADVGDIPSGAVEREVWEEAGLHTRATKIIGVYDANRTGPLDVFHAFKIVFLCDKIDGEPRPSSETSEVAFFKFDELPNQLSSERTRPRHILDAFKANQDPNRLAVFD
jgi:ADP-ribose pyrophosphatase YjhB (NUDIX family)